jgi:hypothetical protein
LAGVEELEAAEVEEEYLRVGEYFQVGEHLQVGE